MFDVPSSDLRKKEKDGGEKAEPANLDAKNENGELSIARKRLGMLFDIGTFEEIGAGVIHRAADFGLEKKRIPGDGVVTGSGEVNGRVVFAYSQDRGVMGGSLGEAHAKKITRVQDLAMRAKVGAISTAT